MTAPSDHNQFEAGPYLEGGYLFSFFRKVRHCRTIRSSPCWSLLKIISSTALMTAPADHGHLIPQSAYSGLGWGFAFKRHKGGLTPVFCAVGRRNGDKGPGIGFIALLISLSAVGGADEADKEF